MTNTVNGAIYLKPGLTDISEILQGFAATVEGADFEESNFCIYVDGKLNSIEALERQLVGMQQHLRGLGLEVSWNDMDFLYTLSPKDRRVCRQNGYLIYQHSFLSEHDTGIVREALDKWSGGDTGKCSQSAQITEKLFDISANLESFPVEDYPL